MDLLKAFKSATGYAVAMAYVASVCARAGLTLATARVADINSSFDAEGRSNLIVKLADGTSWKVAISVEKAA